MISKFSLSVFCAIAILAAQPLSAESIYTCPDIAQTRQVADCPSQAELEHLYYSSCGSRDTKEENLHAKGICKSFDMFKQKKNTALWESADGEYFGYVSCNTPAAEIKSGKLMSISLLRRGVMDKITCSYVGGARFTLRTRQNCELPGGKPKGLQLSLNCTADDSECKVICK